MKNNIIQEFQSKYQFVVNKLYINHLKPIGYKSKGNNFRLIDGSIGRIINFYRPWTNNTENYCFSLCFGIYFETGDRIENTSFKINDCRFEKNSPYFKITDTLSQDGLYQIVEEYYLTEIQPWIKQFIDKKTAIEAIIQGKVSIEFSTIQFLIDNDYGQQLLPVLLDRYLRVESYIAQIDRKFPIPIYRDKTIYNVYLNFNNDSYTLKEVKALSLFMGIKYHEAAILMKNKKVILKSGSAMEIRLILKQLTSCGLHYITEPTFPYEL